MGYLYFAVKSAVLLLSCRVLCLEILFSNPNIAPDLVQADLTFPFLGLVVFWAPYHVSRILSGNVTVLQLLYFFFLPSSKKNTCSRIRMMVLLNDEGVVKSHTRSFLFAHLSLSELTFCFLTANSGVAVFTWDIFMDLEGEGILWNELTRRLSAEEKTAPWLLLSLKWAEFSFLFWKASKKGFKVKHYKQQHAGIFTAFFFSAAEISLPGAKQASPSPAC